MAVLPRAAVSNDNIVKKEFVRSGQVGSLIIALIGLPLIAVCFQKRWQMAKKKGTSWANTTLLSTYVCAFAYVFAMTLLIHVDFSLDIKACDATLLLCLTLYVLTKAAGIAFLIERAYIVSWPVAPRRKTPEYVWTVLLIFVPYIVVLLLCMIYRARLFSEAGICVIGLQLFALIPLMVVEVGAYFYLTLRFLWPLVSLHFGGKGLLLPLKGVVVRTVVGTAITTLSTLAVKISLTMFNGEPAWLCCMTCKLDAVLHTLILHWITKPEPSPEFTPSDSPQALGISIGGAVATETASETSEEKVFPKVSQPELRLRDML